MSFRTRLVSQLQTCHSNREIVPAVSSSCWLRSSSEAVAKTTNKDGGARRIRTDDILLAKQALYQLSYGPALLQEMEISQESWS